MEPCLLAWFFYFLGNTIRIYLIKHCNACLTVGVYNAIMVLLLGPRQTGQVELISQ